jgi:lipoate-protein ligase A
MAVDEFLFRSLGVAPRTNVRFYRWARPTASLGYSQPVDKVLDLDYCRNNCIDVVRRITGGKLVLHWREITYAVASSDTRMFSPTLAESYRRISLALIRGLEKMGLTARQAGPPPSSYIRGNMPCFSRPARDEIEIGGRKIIGSAQKRVGGRFLQHGSIPVQADTDILRKISLFPDDSDEIRMTSLSESLGREVRFEWAVDCLARGIADYFQIQFRPLSFGPEDDSAIREIQQRRYEDEAWTWGRGKTRSLDFSRPE